MPKVSKRDKMIIRAMRSLNRPKRRKKRGRKKRTQKGRGLLRKAIGVKNDKDIRNLLSYYIHSILRTILLLLRNYE